jgi:hypothetical protein
VGTSHPAPRPGWRTSHGTEPAQHRCDPDLAAGEAPVTDARGTWTEFTQLMGENRIWQAASR